MWNPTATKVVKGKVVTGMYEGRKMYYSWDEASKALLSLLAEGKTAKLKGTPKPDAPTNGTSATGTAVDASKLSTNQLLSMLLERGDLASLLAARKS